MTALQFLADSSANDAIREKLREFPNRVYFPNFGKGDNIFKEGIDIDRVLFTVPGTNFKIYWYGFLITIGILLAMIYGFRRMKTVGIDPDRATDSVIGGLIGAIFGARFYYIILMGSHHVFLSVSVSDAGATSSIRRPSVQIQSFLGA